MINDPLAYRTWIEISTQTFHQNVAALQALIQPNTDLGIVVKSNAYGHGLEVVGRLCQEHPAITWLYTAGVQEAVRLRRAGVSKQILAMAYLDGAPSLLSDYGIVMGIGDLITAHRISSYGERVSVHIKVDTGMSRLGFQPASFEQELSILARLPHISLDGIFTHLSDTNNPDLAFTYEQIGCFKQMVNSAQQVLGKKLYAHSLASGALMLSEQFDGVRVGTAVYGHWKSPLQKQRFRNRVPDIELSPIISWKTRVAQVKTLQAGNAVGYNRTYIAPHSMRVALLPVGYADGYPRSLSHKAFVMIRGQPAPVLGLVSMSLLEVDVTHINSVSAGDEVLLCGNVSGLTPYELGIMSDSIANEFLARLSPEIPRIRA